MKGKDSPIPSYEQSSHRLLLQVDLCSLCLSLIPKPETASFHWCFIFHYQEIYINPSVKKVFMLPAITHKISETNSSFHVK